MSPRSRQSDEQLVSVTFAAYPGECFRCGLVCVPTLNTEARTVRVRVELPKSWIEAENLACTGT